MKTCIECGAPVNADGEFEDRLIPERYPHITEFVPHGYTCGICSWGRADQPRTAEDYDAHMKKEHSMFDCICDTGSRLVWNHLTYCPWRLRTGKY